MSKAKYKKYKGNKKSAAAKSTSTPRPVAAAATAAKSAATTKTGPTSKNAAPAAAKEVDFRSEYRYVLGDLKRIGILAAVMFATLVTLALVIR